MRGGAVDRGVDKSVSDPILIKPDFKLPDANVRGTVVEGREFLSKDDLLNWFAQAAVECPNVNGVFLALIKCITSATINQ